MGRSAMGAKFIPDLFLFWGLEVRILMLHSPAHLSVCFWNVQCIIRSDSDLQYACPVWHSSLTVAQSRHRSPCAEEGTEYYLPWYWIREKLNHCERQNTESRRQLKHRAKQKIVRFSTPCTVRIVLWRLECKLTVWWPQGLSTLWPFCCCFMLRWGVVLHASSPHHLCPSLGDSAALTRCLYLATSHGLYHVSGPVRTSPLPSTHLYTLLTRLYWWLELCVVPSETRTETN